MLQLFISGVNGGETFEQNWRRRGAQVRDAIPSIRCARARARAQCFTAYPVPPARRRIVSPPPPARPAPSNRAPARAPAPASASPPGEGCARERGGVRARVRARARMAEDAAAHFNRAVQASAAAPWSHGGWSDGTMEGNIWAPRQWAGGGIASRWQRVEPPDGHMQPQGGSWWVSSGGILGTREHRPASRSDA